MKTNIWKKLSFYAGLLPLGALFGLIAFSATIELKDLDIWLHIATGRFIWENGFVPGYDILSFTIAGQPWDNHEWLFQVLVYQIFNQFGVDGLLQMQVIVVSLTMFLLMVIGYSKEKQFTMLFTLLLVFLVYQQRFTVRPDLFSLLFFAIYIFVLALHIDKRWSRAVLFLTQILWVNFHGFFFFGPLFVLLGIISEWIRRHVPLPYEWNKAGNLTDDEYGRLKSIFLFVVLACLVNPNFLNGAWYPIKVFFSLSGDSKIFFDYIQELQKPILWENLLDTSRYAHYKLLILLSGLSFFFNRRRVDISALLFWVIFLIFSLKASRNVSFFAFAAYLTIITNMYSVNLKNIVPLRFSQDKFKYLSLIFIKILLLAWMFNYAQGLWNRGYFDFDTYKRKSEFGGLTKIGLPHDAADFLVDNKIKGNFFNDFNSGAYLLGRAHPNIKVFIDGRTEAYGADFFKMYRNIKAEGKTDIFAKAVQHYGITGALLNNTSIPVNKDLLKYLQDHKDWVPVYFDSDAVIYLKDDEFNRKWIEKFAIDFTDYQPKMMDLYKLGPMRMTPYPNYLRGYLLEAMGYPELARREAQNALKVNPAYGAPFALLGEIAADQDNYQEAFENFRVAVLLSSRNKSHRINLARSYMDLEKYDYAAREFRKIVNRWPTDPAAYLFLAKVNVLQREYDKVEEFIRKALSINPKAGHDLGFIADAAYNNGDLREAAGLYEWAVELNPKISQIKLNLIKTYIDLDKTQKAEKLRIMLLEQFPDDEDLKNELNTLFGGV